MNFAFLETKNDLFWDFNEMQKKMLSQEVPVPTVYRLFTDRVCLSRLTGLQSFSEFSRYGSSGQTMHLEYSWSLVKSRLPRIIINHIPNFVLVYFLKVFFLALLGQKFDCIQLLRDIQVFFSDRYLGFFVAFTTKIEKVTICQINKGNKRKQKNN